MVRHVSSRALGLFVTVGVILGVVAIIWVGASKYFEKGDRFVTYFNEIRPGPPAGLGRQVPRRGRGSRGGHPGGPRQPAHRGGHEDPAPGRGGKKQRGLAQNRGITGIVFVELDRRDPEEPDLSPRIDFASEYPIIPSRPSQLRQIFSGIDEIVEKIKQVDLEGLSKSITHSAKAAEDLLAGPRTQKVLANLESISVNLDQTMARVEKITAEGNLEGIVGETRAALVEARSLIAVTRDELKALRLAETAEKTNRIVDTLSRTSRTTARDLQVMSDNMKRSSETLERLVERLESNPSDLLFSKPPPAGRRD